MRRRKLAPVVGAVPRSLANLFGAQETYAVGQVRRVVETLRLDDDRVASAYAACCVESEFTKARPHLGGDNYRRLRTELMDLFDIDRPKFNCQHLRALKNIPRSSRWTSSIAQEHDTPGGGSGHDSST